jgi:hypothetical protein
MCRDITDTEQQVRDEIRRKQVARLRHLHDTMAKHAMRAQTRQFRLPPTTGRPELNLYASRSTTDTDLVAIACSRSAMRPASSKRPRAEASTTVW